MGTGEGGGYSAQVRTAAAADRGSSVRLPNVPLLQMFLNVGFCAALTRFYLIQHSNCPRHLYIFTRPIAELLARLSPDESYHERLRSVRELPTVLVLVT